MILRIFKKTIFKYVAFLLALTLAVVLFGSLQLQHPKIIPALAAIVAQHVGFFLALRWAFITLFYFCWPSSIRRRSASKNWPLEKTTFWLQQRTRLTIWLMLFELGVIENVPGALFHYWRGQ